MNRSEKPIASLSVDFDNKWAYLRAAGREEWTSCSSYLPEVAGRMVELLGELSLPLTVFVVGRDLENDRDVSAIESFRQLQRVEFANHSMNHLPWMHTMDPEEIEAEVCGTHQRIAEVLGETAAGFRGPGFSCPEAVLRILLRSGYAYDASIFPTSMAPIARAVFLARTQLKGADKEKAKQLYGGFASMRQPNRPHRRSIDGNRLWEIPVTVMPFSRTPIHFSYFTFLAGHSQWLAKRYFATALRLCKISGTSPSLLLHPPDFLGREDDSDMAYFPGMKLQRESKLRLIRWALSLLSRHFQVHTMIDQVRAIDPSVNSLDPSINFDSRQNAASRYSEDSASSPIAGVTSR